LKSGSTTAALQKENLLRLSARARRGVRATHLIAGKLLFF
jgi:hypothetical protein